MNKKTEKRKFPKKLFYILGYLVVLPIVAFATLFITTYNENKPELFTVNDANGNPYTPKVVSLSKIDSFKFEFICEEYNEPTTNKDGTIKSTSVKFKGRAYDKKDGITITDLTYQYVLASKWVGYQSSKSSTGSLNITTEEFRSVTLSGFNFIYPAKALGFIKIKTPTAYVLLSWKETNSAGVVESKAYFVTYSYDEFVDGNTKGGIAQK